MAEATEIRFNLNGADVVVNTDPKRSALRVLRDDLGHTSLKPGCDPQGICGCCAALVDGKPRLTCTLPVKSLGGKTVITQDGLSPLEAEAFSEAFVSCGGTQCGYCTPGIVMQSKALLDKTPEPSDDDIAKALQMHVCRCTGWKKIHDSVHLAARWIREGQVSAQPVQGALGSTWRQEDLRMAVLGQRPYIDDMVRPGMLHGALRWTPLARCRITGIDTAPALAMPGVRAVLTAADMAGDRKVGLIFRDWPVLVGVGEETRCYADILAAVAADTPELARAAADAIVVEVEALTPLTDLELAAQDPANILATCRVQKGDAAGALKSAAHVVEETFRTQVIDQAFLEPEASLAVPLEDGAWKVYSAGQGVFDDHKQLCALFGLSPEKIIVELVATGGAFGAKEDLNVQPHALALAMKTGRPVKLSLSMEESTRFHPKRHALLMRYRVGCDAEGRLLGAEVHMLGDTGGYASVGDKVMERAAGHAVGPYRVPHVSVEAHTVYTNNPVAGAMRGFGVNQAAFALEGCLERLAVQLGQDPLEFRAKNLLLPGDRFGTGQVMNAGCGVMQTLDAIRPHYAAAKAAGKHVGVACGVKNVGMGNGLREVGRVVLEVRSADEILITTGFTEMGQGHDTAMVLFAAEALGLPPSTFNVVCTTAEAVEVGMTTASRATYLGGNAILAAAPALLAALDETGGALGPLVGRKFVGTWEAPQTHKNEEGVADPVTHYAYGFATQLAIVGSDGRLEEVVAAHDVGRVVNRVACEGQIEGAVHMGIGYALSEELIIDDQGVPDLRFRNLGIVKDRHMPKLTTLLVEHPDPSGPWGVKGVGEIGLVPTAPAIAAAIRSYDGVWRTRLPLRDTDAAKAMGVKPTAKARV